MMTLTLTMILPALLGATLGRAALKRLALMDQNKFEEYTETWNSRLAKWLQVFLILPFALYSFSYALILVIFSLSVAIISILAFAPLILLSPGLLCFLIPAGIIVLIVALTKWRLISFSIPPTFRQRTLVIISIAIVFTELIVLDMSKGSALIFPVELRISEQIDIQSWIAGRRAIPKLVEALSAQRFLAHEARRKLGQLGAPAADAVMPLIKDDNPEVRLHAAYVIVKTNHFKNLMQHYSRDVSVLYPFIQLASDIDTETGNLALHELSNFSQANNDVMINILRSDDLHPDLEVTTIRILRHSKSASIWAILEILSQKKYEVAQGAAVEISKFGDTAVPELIRIIKQKNARLHDLAWLSLAHIGWPAVTPLTDLLKDPEHRKKALVTLMMFKDERITQVLIEEFNKSQDVTFLIALGQRKNDEAAFHFLRKMAQSSNQRIRDAAILALSTLPNQFHEKMDVPSK